MSADTRIWNKRHWDQYFKRETDRLSHAFLSSRMDFGLFYARHDVLSEQFHAYVRARMRLISSGHVDVLEY